MTYFKKRITSIFIFIGDTPIRRPVRPTGPVEKDGPRINEFIRSREVMLIDQEGLKRGVTPIREALALAEEAGLDLVEVSPNPELPVCKILDYGKYRFEQQKKAAEARRNQKIIEIKEIKLRPGIDDHDYEVKMRAVHRFIEDGDKVKITLKFRGREMAHMDLGAKVILRVKADTITYAKVEQEVKLEGKQMMMVLSPK